MTLIVALGACTSTDAPPKPPIKEAFVISYAAAANGLNGLSQFEQTEQLRDWIRFGLASHLELDTTELRDATYDTLAVRDPGLADFSRLPTGPGRSLFDGDGVLHVLVQRGDRHRSRTVGLLVDQHRADTGADPDRVRVHDYHIDTTTQTISVISNRAEKSSNVRAAHGYVTKRVDQRGELTDFLAKNRYLSQLELRGEEVWASGWAWPDESGAALDFADVSVLQRGYLRSERAGLPGFSLDPGPGETKDDLLAVMPSLNPDLADRIVAGQSDVSAESVLQTVLFDEPLPESVSLPGEKLDRSQLWSLLGALEGQPTYSQARYDGMLNGTEVGMTLFYADYIAKDWTSGVGDGVPTKAVDGFEADPDAEIPWSHCQTEPQDESGRLWFGQADTGFTVAENRVDIGAQATRLFAKSDSADGTEIERSYSFGRALRWWDSHYQAIADYEPQYRRLEQIMRWSGALEWLVSKSTTHLPGLGQAEIKSDWQFADWYAKNDQLRERKNLPFVDPPSAEEEALRTTPSKSYPYCGLHQVTGGVSLSDMETRKGDQSYRPVLPAPVNRAGLLDESSSVDPATGAGHISHVSIDGNGTVVGRVERTFTTAPDGHAVVDVTAGGSRAASFGELKVWRDAAAPRNLRVDLSADKGTVKQGVQLQGHQVGELVAHKPSRALVAIQFVRGAVNRVLNVFRSAEKPAWHETLLSFQQPSGRPAYLVGNGKWLSVDPLQPAGADLSFRIGSPDGTASQAVLTAGPQVPPGTWFSVSRPTADGPGAIQLVPKPGKETRTIKVNTTDGKSSTLYWDGSTVTARWDDPILGPSGSVASAALLRDFHPMVANTIRGPPADPTHLQGVQLGFDAAALVGADGITLINQGHPWYSQVLRAIGPEGPAQPPRFTFDGQKIKHVADIAADVRYTGGEADLSDLLPYAGDPDTPMYLHSGQIGAAPLEQGSVLVNPIPRGTQVMVRQIHLTELPAAAVSYGSPQIYRYRGEEWTQVLSSFQFGGGGNGGGGGANAGQPRLPIPLPVGVPSTTTTTKPSGQASAPDTRSGRWILLVCIQDEDEETAGCWS